MNREQRQIEENVIHPLLQEAQPPCFVEQKLIRAKKGSEAREGPIDCAINTQTGRKIQNAARRMHRELCNAFHSTEKSPKGAAMTRVIGFLQL